MEKTFCTYHPVTPASWRCSGCDASFCADCISRRELGGYRKTSLYLCPKCGGVAEALPVQNILEPFWSRLPKIFAYPCEFTVILFMVILSVFMTLFSGPDLLSAVIQLLLFGVLLKYCFAVLKQTAQGNIAPPKINEHTISDDFIIVAKYWLLGVLFFAAGLGCFIICLRLSAGIGPAAGMALFAACVIALLLILPAEVIVLAASGSLRNALNPAVSVRMALRIGLPYLLMYFFLTILYLAPGTLVYFIRPYFPNVVSSFVFALANCYYSIVAHHLMGYVILQHHDTIGYEVDLGEQNVRPGGRSERISAARDLLNQVNILIKEGKHGDAADLIPRPHTAISANLELAERYYQLLKLVQRNQEMLAHAHVVLDLLVKANRVDKARSVYLECTVVDPLFNPRAPVLFKIASSLSEAGNHRAALEAYNRFIRHSPEDPLAAKAYFLAATVFHEKMLDPERAAKALKRLIKKFPGHEIIPYAEKYLRRIEQNG